MTVHGTHCWRETSEKVEEACVLMWLLFVCVCSGFQNEFVILPVAFCVICTFVVLCLLNFFHVWILCYLSRSQVFNLHGVVGEEVKGNGGIVWLPSPAGTCRPRWWWLKQDRRISKTCCLWLCADTQWERGSVLKNLQFEMKGKRKKFTLSDTTDLDWRKRKVPGSSSIMQHLAYVYSLPFQHQIHKPLLI